MLNKKELVFLRRIIRLGIYEARRKRSLNEEILTFFSKEFLRLNKLVEDIAVIDLQRLFVEIEQNRRLNELHLARSRTLDSRVKNLMSLYTDISRVIKKEKDK